MQCSCTRSYCVSGSNRKRPPKRGSSSAENGDDSPAHDGSANQPVNVDAETEEANDEDEDGSHGKRITRSASSTSRKPEASEVCIHTSL